MTDRSISPALTVILALVAGFGGAAAWQYSGLGDARMRQTLLDQPEILPQLAQAYDKQQGRERLAQAGEALKTPFPGAILGNPKGTVTLVEFTDYACGFCRISREHVEQLVAANPDLKVVIREWPIFEGSDVAAKMALAAADQGKFAEFHHAMFLAGNPDPATIAQATREAGLDMEKATAFAASKAVQFELGKNAGFARQLAVTGTPAWVIGDQVLDGAVGTDKLQAAIDAARGKK